MISSSTKDYNKLQLHTVRSISGGYSCVASAENRVSDRQFFAIFSVTVEPEDLSSDLENTV